jgi:hypothetical protein
VLGAWPIRAISANSSINFRRSYHFQTMPSGQTPAEGDVRSWNHEAGSPVISLAFSTVSQYCGMTMWPGAKTHSLHLLFEASILFF